MDHDLYAYSHASPVLYLLKILTMLDDLPLLSPACLLKLVHAARSSESPSSVTPPSQQSDTPFALYLARCE